jgi:hypothetical protein
MNTILVVITYLAGSAWGPVVSMVDTPSVDACKSTRSAVATGIAKAAKSNISGGAVTVDVDDDDIVVTTAAGREVARLSCTPSKRKG